MESKQLQSARDLYLKEAKLDPYKGAYRVNLAQIAAIKANRDKDASAAGEGLNHARIASELEPYNTSLHAAVFSIYGMLGRPDLQLSEAESAIRANPYLPAPYEQMAGVTMQIAMQYLDKGQNEDAFSYFRKLLLARNKMPAEIGDSTPGFNLAAGQSALLLGETDQARKYFNLLLQDENKHVKTARLWLKGVDFMEARMKSRIDGTTFAIPDLSALQVFLKQQKS